MPITNEIYRNVPRPLLYSCDIIVHRGMVVKDRCGDLPIVPSINENAVIESIIRLYEISWYNRPAGILILNRKI